MHFNLLNMDCANVYKLLQMYEIRRVRERERGTVIQDGF